jgi:hypothetical protein
MPGSQIITRNHLRTHVRPCGAYVDRPVARIYLLQNDDTWHHRHKVRNRPPSTIEI